MAILYGMANPTIKATYTLDVETLRVLERAAKRWGVSKSEALRRAIRASASIAAEPETPLAALDELPFLGDGIRAMNAVGIPVVQVPGTPVAAEIARPPGLRQARCHPVRIGRRVDISIND